MICNGWHRLKGEHIPQIMHCWHYVQKSLMKFIKLNNTSCCLIKGMVLQVWMLILMEQIIYDVSQWLMTTMVLNGLLLFEIASAQGEHGQIDTTWHIQNGSPIKDFNRYLGGVWTAEGENFLVCTLPLMSKGESDLVWWLPSSPKGEIVGIMLQVLSLMATHSEV